MLAEDDNAGADTIQQLPRQFGRHHGLGSRIEHKCGCIRGAETIPQPIVAKSSDGRHIDHRRRRHNEGGDEDKHPGRQAEPDRTAIFSSKAFA